MVVEASVGRGGVRAMAGGLFLGEEVGVGVHSLVVVGGVELGVVVVTVSATMLPVGGNGARVGWAPVMAVASVRSLPREESGVLRLS